MAEPNFPLRWESIGDQWWYASPIDWAAANGLYDLVRELLHVDTNLLIKLTSLRRIRRLETVWDDSDDGRRFAGVAANRCRVARKLLAACESGNGRNSLVRAGYGGWLLYTAASAGDAAFVGELLERDPLLVYGEGEYGLTDLLCAAARGRSAEVFRRLVGLALAPPGGGAEVGAELRQEVVNRAVHAAARGGNPEMLREVLEENGGDICGFRDDQGCTVLHSASGRGQVEVVKYLVKHFDITACTDDQGNTALHVAAYRGYLDAVKVLMEASPSLPAMKNNYGDTFLHMAVAGFRAPGFRRLDKLVELMKHLLRREIHAVKDAINARNGDGRTALHVAVSENVHISAVELLMAAPSVDLNVRDANGMTLLDLLRRRPRSASSEILIKRLIAAGGISNCWDQLTRNALVSQLKTRGIGTSPGTSFRIPDAEIFLYTGVDNVSDASCEDGSSAQFGALSGDLGRSEPTDSNEKSKKAFRRLNFLLRWPKRKGKKAATTSELGDTDSLDSFNRQRDFEDCHIPLRQIYGKPVPSPNGRHTCSANGATFPSPSTKMKFAAGLMHGVIKTNPHFAGASPGSSSASPPQMPPRPSLGEKRAKKAGERKGLRRHESLDEKLMMNDYFCFGAQGEDSLTCNAKLNNNINNNNNNNHNYTSDYRSLVA